MAFHEIGEYIANIFVTQMIIMQDCTYVCKDDHAVHSPEARNVDLVFELHEAYVLTCNDIKDYALGLATPHRINSSDSDISHAGGF